LWRSKYPTKAPLTAALDKNDRREVAGLVDKAWAWAHNKSANMKVELEIILASLN
jgi:hypothetical protein